MNKPLIIFLFLFSNIVHATSDVSSIDKPFSDTFKIRVGGYLVARNDTTISATTPYLIGAKINLQDDLGMSGQTKSGRIDSHYRFDDFHKIEFSYYNIRNSNTKVTDKAFEYDGVEYQAGAEIDAHLNLNIYKLNYAYSFYHNEKVELALAAGLHMIGIKSGLAGNASIDGEPVTYTDENTNVLAPLPVVGFRIDYAVSPRFHVQGAFDYFGVSYDDFSGSFTDLLITGEYQMFDDWSAGVGVNITSLDIGIKNTKLYEIEQDVTGILVYVAYNY